MSTWDSTAQGSARASGPFPLSAAVLESLPAAVGVKSCDGVYLGANRSLAAMAGVPVEAVVGRSDAQIFPPTVADELRRQDLEVQQRGEIRRFDITAVLDGQHCCYACQAFPIRDANAAILAVGIMMADSTEPAHREAEAREAASRCERANAELRRALVESEMLAATDRPTGAWSRRRLDDAVAIEMSRAERYAQSVALLMISIDSPDQTGDPLGEAAAEGRLAELVGLMRGLIRKADSITRWSARELMILAPSARVAEAARLGEKLRDAVAAATFAGEARLTVSIGGAEYQRGEGFDAWLARAERAHAQAGGDGGNQVVVDPLTAFGERRRPSHGSSLLQLAWRDVYASGHPLIDGQHQRLFELANNLLDRVVTGASREAVFRLAEELIVEIGAHFADEEDVQREIGYPGVEEHAEEHAQLLAKASRLRQYVSKGTMLPTDFFQFLAYEVIMQHMVGTDRSYFEHLNRIEVPTTRMQ